MRVNNVADINPGSIGGQDAACPQGGLLISGSCTNVTSSAPDLTLQQSGFYRDDSQGWGCTFKNNSASPVTIKVSAICLVPGT